MKKVLLIDVSSIFYRAHFSLSKRFEAVDTNGRPSTGTYGFFTTLFKVINEVSGIDKYLFAIDVKGSTSVRKAKNTEYKASRTQKPQSLYDDLQNLLTNYVPLLDIMPLGLAGYEADDIIASACNYMSKEWADEELQIYILSGDGDLEQCIKYGANNPKHSYFFIKTQPAWKIIGEAEVLEKWGGADVNPNSITLLKAIIGDGSDNIRGIKGYKIKKALKVYEDEEWLNLPENKEIIEHNIDILQMRDDLEVVPRPINLSESNLEKLFINLNSKTLLQRLRAKTLIK